MSTSTGKVFKWGTVLTWALGGSKAAPIIVSILTAFCIFVGILFAASGSVGQWVREGVDAGNAATSTSQPTPTPTR